MRYGMSFPVSSWQAVVAIAALETPRTLRNSRRLTPVFCLSWLMSVVAVRAVVPRFLALARVRRRRRLLRGGIARGLEPFLRAVAVDVTAHTPTHVEAGILEDAVHSLHLAVTRLAGDAGVHVTRVREVDVLRHLVNSHPRNRLRVRAHARTHPGDIRKLVELLQFCALSRRTQVRRGTIRPDHVVAPDACADGRKAWIGRLVRRVVTIEAIHPELLHVNRVREVDRLNGRAVLRRGGAAVGREHDGAGSQEE